VVAQTAGISLEGFAADEWSLDAVLRNLTVIGEAASHVPDEMCAWHPEIPWQDMRDMRNIVVHECFGVDLDVVWRTIQEDLPALISLLEPLVEEEP
jgi:hypothetical protein